MPEKLLNLKEASRLLGMPEEQITALAEKGEIPAYKIGGSFLRFRREQLEAIGEEVKGGPAPARPRRLKPAAGVKEEISGQNNLFDRIADFIYFSDFYILSALLILGMLYVILR